MRIKRLLAIPVIFGAWVGGHAATPAFEMPDTAKITRAIEYQLDTYPASQLADVYKNFFQDYYGPGHILADKNHSRAYLLEEMSDTTVAWEGPIFEPTGANGNFVRVNMSVIRDGDVTFDTYFDAFARSIEGIVPPSDAEWRSAWSRIDSVLTSHGATFRNEVSDREMIAHKLADGDFAVHHSKVYNDTYHFHYRIFSREIFEKEILPKISKDTK